MAIGISKSQEGIEALKKMSSTMLRELESIEKAHDFLEKSYESVKANMAHEDEIEEILDEVRSIQSNIAKPVTELSGRLNSLATKLDNFLNSGLGGS